MKVRIFATVFLLLLLPALTYAATIGVAKTGQSICYNASGTAITCVGTGQDGDIQAGAAWPNPRFTDSGNQTVTDNMTGLEWSKDANPPGEPKTWQESLDYIKTLNSSSYRGHSDWRLPNKNELDSLTDNSRISPALPSGHPFINVVPGYPHWSSTTIASSAYAAWSVNMDHGGVDIYGKTSVGNVWPVRGGQSGTLGSLIIHRTGQTACYNASGDAITCAGTGQDGEIQAGAAWPNPRFTDNCNQTVSDNMTRLEWSKDANPPGGTKTWQESLDYIKTLNSSSYRGHSDWRLPNKNELASLIDNSRSTPALLSGHPFVNVQANSYWSSSTYLDSPSRAWVVNMDDGNVVDDDKTSTNYVWLVRTGQICTYNLSPASYAFSAASNTGTVNVTPSSSSCTWTATTNDSWITITSGACGMGNGTVTYGVAADTTGIARTGTIAIAGQTTTIYQAKGTFADDPANVFTPYIYAIYSQGITVGCGGGNYCPSMAVSRGQMAAFIIRSVYGETFSYATTPYFSDVPVTNDYFKYVQKMKETGITNVTGTYMVDQTVTRGQMAAFIIRAKYGESFSYTATPYFSDVPVTNDFFKYVQKMKDSGYTTQTGTYLINDWVTRDQMAAFLGRAFLGMQNSTTTQVNNLTGVTDIVAYKHADVPTTQRNTAIQVSDSAAMTVIATGVGQSITLKGDNTVRTWNTSSQPGDGPTPQQSTPVQAGLCTYALTPANYGYSSAGNTGKLTVTASASSCTWTATSGYPWLTITSGSSTTGNGTVTYSVAANTSGGAQTGIMTIAGQTVIIYQAKDTFADITGNAYAPYIYATYSQGITGDCGRGNYCPSIAVSSGQMAALIIKSIYGETFNYTPTPYFSDVPNTNDYFKYVQKMKDEGNINTTATYNVDGIVTRGQATASIIRAKYGETFSYTQTPYFTDVPTTHTFFKYVQKMKDEGYATVTGAYDVNGTVTREQIAAFLGRAFLGMQ